MRIKALAILLSGALTHWGALAHAGHGMGGSGHWHATDVLGFVAIAAVATVLWCMGRRK